MGPFPTGIVAITVGWPAAWAAGAMAGARSPAPRSASPASVCRSIVPSQPFPFGVLPIDPLIVGATPSLDPGEGPNHAKATRPPTAWLTWSPAIHTVTHIATHIDRLGSSAALRPYRSPSRAFRIYSGDPQRCSSVFQGRHMTMGR